MAIDRLFVKTSAVRGRKTLGPTLNLALLATEVYLDVASCGNVAWEPSSTKDSILRSLTGQEIVGDKMETYKLLIKVGEAEIGVIKLSSEQKIPLEGLSQMLCQFLDSHPEDS